MKVLAQCREWGVDLILCNIHEDKLAFDRLRELGGKTQVPALQIDDKIMYESEEILVFLSDYNNGVRT